MAIRKAVSILLTPDPDATDVYLVERNPRLKFFGGYYAFPGGTLDKTDENITIKNASKLPEDSVPYIVAAVREVFEETGIFLSHGKTDIPADLQQTYRKQLLADKIHFDEILRNENQYIDAADFHFICSIITPEFSPVRYDTQFYWIKIPDGARPDIWPGELLVGKFYSAEQALRLWKRGEILIVPPVIFMLQELINRSIQNFTTYILEYAHAYRKGKIHQVYFTPGIQLIALQTRTLLPATHTNTYLIGESELYIVDPAPSGNQEQERLWAYLDDMIKEGRKLKGILLTHHHPDHIGALQPCQLRYDLPVLAHKKTAEKLPQLQFIRHLKHDDELNLGPGPDGQSGWKLKVYHTPGHAAGHLSFQESRYGAILAGDLISTVSTIVISPPEGHLATYLRSLEFLETVTTGMLYPGHGPAVRNGKKIIQYYIKHRQHREQKLLNVLSKVPQSTFELVEKVY
ncbi:MAG: MBL fold metallo-hydrolase, partial [bacterium]